MVDKCSSLKIVDPDKEFVVCTYACKVGLSAVLMQEVHVVCYESRKINEHEQKYVTHDLELETIFHALKIWRYHLLGRRFVLMRDHCGLRYLFDQPNLNSRHAGWLAMISEFEFDIRYINGKENRVADALRRRVKMNHVVIVRLYGTNL